MKRFLIKMLAVMVIPAGMVLTNLIVDPADLFHQAAKKKIAEYMLEGMNITHLFHHDKRQSLPYYAGALDQPKEILVFGSSRTMLINQTFFPDNTFFNAGVPGAALEDLLACYEVFHERGLIPKRVILGPEVYMLNATLDDDAYLKAEYQHALERLGLAQFESTSPWLHWIDVRYTQLFSPSYFQASFAALPKFVKKGRPVPEATREPETEDRMLCSDGSLIGARIERLRPPEAVRQMAIEFVVRPPRDISWIHHLDPERQRIFETFVKSLIDEGVDVDFLLAPYHPAAYELMLKSPDFKMIMDAEAYYTAFAAQQGVDVFGSYDPNACGCTDTDFSDGHHPTKPAIARIFNAGPRKPATP